MKFNEIFETKSMLAEMAGGNIGLALTDISANISTEIRRDSGIKKIVPWLIYLAALKIFMDNHKKFDKDNKLLISLLGAGANFIERDKIGASILSTVGKDKAIEKSKELMVPKDGNVVVNQEVLNQWTIALRKFVEDKHKKLQDYMRAQAAETNAERTKRIDKKIDAWQDKRRDARKKADMKRAMTPVTTKKS